jgi:hypothetical protein
MREDEMETPLTETEIRIEIGKLLCRLAGWKPPGAMTVAEYALLSEYDNDDDVRGKMYG